MIQPESVRTHVELDAAPSSWATPSPPADQPRGGGLLEQVLAGGNAGTPGGRLVGTAGGDADDRGEPSQLDRFLAAESVAEKLRLWLGDDFLRREAGERWGEVAGRLQGAVAAIDAALCRQLERILHHSDFQQLEATWRGVAHLTDCKDRAGDAPIRVRVLNAGWAEIRRDFDRASEFDQSELFRKIYEDEFGTPGGQPYGALLADFEVHPRPSPEHPHDDISVLKSLAQVAAAAFCPVFLNASPTMFGVDRFDQMQQSVDYSKVQGDLDFLAWRQFRQSEDARFIGLVMPRMLMRRPYGREQIARCGFSFEEYGRDRDGHLWGGAVYAVGETLIRAFGQSRWLADVRGAQRGVEGGGLVLGPVYADFATDSPDVTFKVSTETVISDTLEQQLTELGFIPLCACKDAPFSAFYSCPSTQKPKAYNTPDATANAKISAMLNYMLCVSRFSHYVKVICRDKVGGFRDAESLQRELHDWLMNYVVTNPDAGPSIKAGRPLRDAQVRVLDDPGKPGSYRCVLQLSPHYELDDMQASIRLVTELAPRG